jgi:hypothetical protein
LAEFQIKEADIEKGEVELEYDGAYHWGVPKATEDNENANDFVQSHELEFQTGGTDWWLLSVTAGCDVHGIGPTLFTNFGGNDDEAKGRDDDEHQVKAGDDNERADRHQWRSR